MVKHLKGKNDYCAHCEEFNAVLDGICCKCGWHVLENRPATDEEAQPIRDKLDAAIEQLGAFLENRP